MNSENVVDVVIYSGPSHQPLVCTELGYEQLAQRGCQTSLLSSLSLDLTSRLVSMEELFLSLSSRVTSLPHNAPAVWWDRTCDIGLILGTFIHGLGNYESMLNDDSLPFARCLKKYVTTDVLSADAHKRFVSVASATKGVCDAALEASKLKAQKEVQKAVAAAAAASTERETDAAKLREGVADQDLISNMSEQKIDNLYEIEGGHDAHFITLPRIRSTLVSTLRGRTMPIGDLLAHQKELELAPATGVDEARVRRRLSSRLSLSMPDARILNFRLRLLLTSIDKQHYGEVFKCDNEKFFLSPKIWPSSREVETCWRMREASPFREEAELLASEYSGIGIAGTQSGAFHRAIDDRSDFSIAAANADLNQVAHGPESARYLRALGVPMSFGRFALLGMLYAEEKCLYAMLNNENRKYLYEGGTDTLKTDKKNDVKSVPVENPSSTTDASTNSNNATPPPVSTKFDPITPKKVEPDESEKAIPITKDESPTIKDETIPTAFRQSSELRAGVCMVVCYFGFPTKRNGTKVDDTLWTATHQHEEGSNELFNEVFSPSQFLSLLKDHCLGAEIPEWDAIVEYVEMVFLPHCLKLCIYGNGFSTTDARGSKGMYETYDGSSRYVEPTEKLQSPLPDPCLQMQAQSIEAVGMACAILRRNRLMRCLTDVATGEAQFENLVNISKSPVFRQAMDGLPVWWCPWIHDLALVSHATTRGLFSVFLDRHTSALINWTAFSKLAISEHILSTFFGSNSTIPKIVSVNASVEDKATWAATAAEEFPSMNVVERRLAFLCSLATEKSDGDKRFDNLPMYDHGAWPRN